MAETVYQSPLGPIRLREAYGHITHLDWGPALQSEPDRNPPPCKNDTPLLNRAVHQLNAYFFGNRCALNLPVAPAGTKFQKAVWKQILAIPYGEVRTYGEMALWLRSSPRAVGVTCGRNPIPIIIPCHRVVAASGLGGYSGSGGIDTKQWLLKLEGWPSTASPSLFDLPASADDRAAALKQGTRLLTKPEDARQQHLQRRRVNRAY